MLLLPIVVMRTVVAHGLVPRLVLHRIAGGSCRPFASKVRVEVRADAAPKRFLQKLKVAHWVKRAITGTHQFVPISNTSGLKME
jgi:hypothetical protein